MASAAETKPAGDWKFLQKRVFARWLNNKLLARQKSESEPVKISKITEENILTCWSTGHQLVALIEVLSKKDCPYKKQMRTDFKMKIQQIENINYALKFCWEGGVQLELHPSAENILDGDERMVMGLIWGIMRSFLNFGFDDERLSVADALLKWVRGQISPYPQLSVNNFTSHWHNGLIFCALIHRYRPDLIGDFNALDRAEGEKNLTLALAGAEKWFGLDQYITPADIPILDDKSMIIYVSEWYTGITSFGKSIMAAQRIAKIIDYTVENDKIKEDYTNRAKAWRGKVEPLIKQLDEPIGSDDSLDSIRSKLDSFEKYQTGEKPKLLAEHLDLESILSYLQIRLADSNHPIWLPEAGIRLADLRQLAEQLDAIEAKRNAALRNELNRQLKLLELSSEHESLYSQIQAYLSSKSAQVAAKNEINTVSIGEFQLNTLQTLLSEVQALQGSDVAELQNIGKKLAEANFSGMAIVQQRETAVDDALNSVRNAAASKAKFLEDTIAVLSFKDNLELLVSAHASKADALQSWCAQHKSNLQSLVDSLQNNLSIASAKRAVYSLKVLNTDRADKIRTDVSALKKAGAEISGAQLDSQFSGTITYTDAAVISAREDDISHEFQSLDQLSAQKESQLNAILSSEQQKDKLRLDYANMAAAFVRFVESAVERANSQKLWGRTIAEVTSNAPGDDVLTEANAKLESAQKAHAATPQSENPYTALTVADLQAAQNKLVAAFASRKQRYDAELAAITEQDAVFKAFADIAVPFIKQLQLAKEEITNSAEALDKQLADVQSRLEATETSSDINAVTGFQGKLGGQTSYNPYTQITVEECVTTFTQFKSFLQSKQKALNEQIEASKNRGITKEQLAEWHRMFVDYDKDHSGWLSADEFRSVLFALGEKRKPEEITKLMEEYGNADKHIDFDGFKRFMVLINGQSLSKDEIANSFDLINKNDPYLNLEAPHVQTSIPKNAREYLARNAPKNENGEVDIKKFIDDLFSR